MRLTSYSVGCKISEELKANAELSGRGGREEMSDPREEDGHGNKHSPIVFDKD